MKLLRLLLVSILLLSLALSFTACGGSSEKPAGTNQDTVTQQNQGSTSQQATNTGTPATQSDKKIKIGFTIQNLNNPFFVMVTEGVKKYGAENGCEVTIAPASDNVNNQISSIENFVAQKMDAIIIMAVEPKAVSPSAKAAMDAGIKVLTMGSKLDDYTSEINVDQHEVGMIIGQQTAKWVKEKLDGKGEIGLITAAESPEIISRSKGIREGILKDLPDANIVAEAQGLSTAEGMKIAENFLQAHPNMKAIACYGDAVALGAMEAVKAAGKANDDFFIFGADANPQALDAIKNGSVFRGTIDYNTATIPTVAVDTCIKLAKGEIVEKSIMLKLNTVDITNADKFITK